MTRHNPLTAFYSLVFVVLVSILSAAQSVSRCKNADFDLTGASVTHVADLARLLRAHARKHVEGAGPGGHRAGHDKPMLGVYEEFEILSGNLSLPYGVVRK